MAITPQTLQPDTFARKVIEDRLEVRGPYQGYFYAGIAGKIDGELYRVFAGKKWLWQSRIIFQQTNAAGGAIISDYSLANEQYARLVEARMTNSGNNGIVIAVYDEDNAYTLPLASVGAAAGTVANLPSIGTAASASNNLASSVNLILLPGQKLGFVQSGAGVQNDTSTVALSLELYNLGTEPTISTARSTNPSDVTTGTDSISDANDLLEVVC